MKKRNPYTLYRLTESNVLVEADLEKEITQLGLTVGEVLAALADTQKQLAQKEKEIQDFLNRNGVKSFDEIYHLHPQVKYIAVLADSDNVVQSAASIDNNVMIIRDENYKLKEITKGYHRIENNKVVEDPIRKFFRHL